MMYNHYMIKHKRYGFTLIEVALFLAITGALFVGIVAGTQNSIWHQKFNDATQNFAEFLRSIYSEVSNPQSIGDGRSEYAIYGKLVVFGEKLDGEYKTIDYSETQKIFVYDVVGNLSGGGTGAAGDMLTSLNANVVIPVEWWSRDKVKRIEPAGIVENYSPRWASAIETTKMNELFTGSILVIRHPRSGTINTLVSKEVIEVNNTLRDANNAFSGHGSYNFGSLLASKLNTFVEDEIDFCINPNGIGAFSNSRRDIRLVKNARNASGVEIIDLDSSENVCK